MTPVSSCPLSYVPVTVPYRHSCRAPPGPSHLTTWQRVRPWLPTAPVMHQGQRSIRTSAAASVDGVAEDEAPSNARSQRRSRRTTRAHRVTVHSDQQQPPIAADTIDIHQRSTTTSTRRSASSITNQQAAPVSDHAVEVSVQADLADSTGHASSTTRGQSVTNSSASRSSKTRTQGSSRTGSTMHGAYVMVPQPLPRVLILHTGGTLGMDVSKSACFNVHTAH